MVSFNPRKIKSLGITALVGVSLVVYAFSALTGNHDSSSESPVVTISASPEPMLVTDATVTPLPVDAPVVNSGIVSKLNSLTVTEASGVSYDRGEWHHWADITPCWSVREQVLADEAVQDGSLTLLDKYKVRTTDLSKACYVAGGTWVDPYTGETFTNPSDLDIDHMIPLNYAAQHGGQVWDSGKKESYANNRDYAGHLKAVSASANRSKSDKGPSQWKPSNQANWCEYATDWVNISSTWNLTVTGADKNALADMLSTCK